MTIAQNDGAGIFVTEFTEEGSLDGSSAQVGPSIVFDNNAGGDIVGERVQELDAAQVGSSQAVFPLRPAPMGGPSARIAVSGHRQGGIERLGTLVLF